MNRILLILILWCPVVLAQFVVEQPFFSRKSAVATAPFSPADIGGLAYWWVFSDMPTNIIVTNWVDRIRGAAWTNFSGIECPTNSNLGVFFDRANSQFLTNYTTGLISLGSGSGSTNSHWAIVSTGHIPSGARTLLFSETNSTDRVFGQFDASTPEGRWTFGGGSPAIIPGWTTNFQKFSDLCGICDDAAANMVAYTNAVNQGTNTTAGRIGNNTTWMRLGKTRIDTSFMHGYVKEIAIYTNVALSYINVSNLHYYATNLYGYTP